MTQPDFVPSMEAARRQLGRVSPEAYAKSRNFLDGAVTYLSPWITHGFLNTRDAAVALRKRFPLSFEHKLIFEFAWREFFKHVHGHLLDGILTDIRRPVFHGKYSRQMPLDVLEARTGVPVIDQGVSHLYNTGYLHNHMRMWIASYLVHLRKVHWRVGADWMYKHLLDGDLASNHLSWQWVAGTFSHKPYVFNAENVSKYAAHIDCTGTVIDTDYSELGSMAAAGRDCGPERGAPHVGVEEPRCIGDFSQWIQSLPPSDPIRTRLEEKLAPNMRFAKEDQLNDLAGQLKLGNAKSIRLVHPWDLRHEHAEQTGEFRLGVVVAQFHQSFAWSERRWAFVGEAMAKQCDGILLVDASTSRHLKTLVRDWVGEDKQLWATECFNPSYHSLFRELGVKTEPVDAILPDLSSLQPSFSRYYSKASGVAGSLDEALGVDTERTI